MADAELGAAASAAPRRAVLAIAAWLLLAAPVIALLMAYYALALAVLIFPLGDLAPLLVLAVSLLARRWHAVRSRLFDVSAALAGVAVLEWVAAYAYVSAVESALARSNFGAIGVLFTAYVVQSVVMLGLFSVACWLAASSLLHLRKAGRASA